MSYPSIVLNQSPAINMAATLTGASLRPGMVRVEGLTGHMFENQKKVDPWLKERHVVRKLTRYPDHPKYASEPQPYHFISPGVAYMYDTSNKYPAIRPPDEQNPVEQTPLQTVMPRQPINSKRDRLQLATGGSDSLYGLKAIQDNYGSGGSASMFIYNNYNIQM